MESKNKYLILFYVFIVFIVIWMWQQNTATDDVKIICIEICEGEGYEMHSYNIRICRCVSGVSVYHDYDIEHIENE